MIPEVRKKIKETLLLLKTLRIIQEIPDQIHRRERKMELQTGKGRSLQEIRIIIQERHRTQRTPGEAAAHPQG